MTAAALSSCVSAGTLASHLSGVNIAPLRRKASLPDDTRFVLGLIPSAAPSCPLRSPWFTAIGPAPILTRAYGPWDRLWFPELSGFFRFFPPPTHVLVSPEHLGAEACAEADVRSPLPPVSNSRKFVPFVSKSFVSGSFHLFHLHFHEKTIRLQRPHRTGNRTDVKTLKCGGTTPLSQGHQDSAILNKQFIRTIIVRRFLTSY